MNSSRWWMLAGVLVLVGGSARAQDCTAKPCRDHCVAAPCTSNVESRLQTLVHFEVKDTSLRMALEDLHEMTGLDIVVDQAAVNENGIDLDQPITLNVDGVPMKSVLTALLHSCHLSWLVQDGGIRVTTETVARVMPDGPTDTAVVPTGAVECVPCPKTVCGGKCCCDKDTPCAAGCTPDNCCCKQGKDCGSAGCAKGCPAHGCDKAGCVKPWACVGAHLGAMVGAGVDQPHTGAMIGSCVGAFIGRMMGCGPCKQTAFAEPFQFLCGAPCVCCPPMPPCVCCPPAPPCCVPCACTVPAPMACGSWTLSTCQEGIHIAGPGVEGGCDRVSFGGPDGCVTLEGHVHLKCHKDGRHAEVSADRVCVRLADMSVQVNGNCPAPMPPCSDNLGSIWMGFTH